MHPSAGCHGRIDVTSQDTLVRMPQPMPAGGYQGVYSSERNAVLHYKPRLPTQEDRSDADRRTRKTKVVTYPNPPA